MKHRSIHWLSALAIILSSSCVKNFAAVTYVDVASFSAGNFSIDPQIIGPTPSQGSQGVTVNGGIGGGDTFYGQFTSPLDLSIYTGIGLLMSVTTNPNVFFTVTLTQTDSSTAVFEGVTTGLTSSFSSNPLTWKANPTVGSSVPISSLTSVEYFQISWDGIGTINTTLGNLQAVPEPATTSLLLLGGLGLVALRRLRKV